MFRATPSTPGVREALPVSMRVRSQHLARADVDGDGRRQLVDAQASRLGPDAAGVRHRLVTERSGVLLRTWCGW